jgi:hypothetical protein
MSYIRTSFGQTCNFNNNQLYPGASGMICSIGFPFNNDDKDQNKTMSNMREVIKP